MRKDGQDFRSRMDYILGTDIIFFQDVAIREMQHHSDHYMFLGCLRWDPEKELIGCLRKACRFPLRPLCRDLAATSDKIFSDLNTQIPNPPLHERVRRAWISDKTWAAIDARVTARREGVQRNVRKLIRRIHAGLSTDWKRRVEEAGRTIESFLASYPPPPCKRFVVPDAGVVQ